MLMRLNEAERFPYRNSRHCGCCVSVCGAVCELVCDSRWGDCASCLLKRACLPPPCPIDTLNLKAQASPCHALVVSARPPRRPPRGPRTLRSLMNPEDPEDPEDPEGPDGP